MKFKDIIHLRLYNQLVSHKPFHQVKEVVHWMGAMQAQDYLASLLAIGIRTFSSTPVTQSTVEQAIAKGEIVRTWPMRGTLHFVAATDVRWMLRLLTPRVIRSSAGRYRQLGLDAPVFTKSRKIVEQGLEGGKQLSRQELYGILEKGGIPTSDQRGIHILSHLAQTEEICFGPRRNRQPTFVLLEEWVPAKNILEQEEALAALANRYFKSHGPATAYDFATWAGMKITDARKGIELVKSGFEQAQMERQTYWFPEPLTGVETKASWLLPAFDEMLCGYRDKSALVHSDNVKSTLLKNGIIRPVIICENQVAGTWSKNNKSKTAIVPEFFRPLPKTAQKAIEDKAEKLEGFFEG